MQGRDPLDDPHTRSRAILSVASVSWVILGLPMSMATAVSWLGQKDLEHSAAWLRWSARAWFATGSLFLPLCVMSVLFAWRLHRGRQDKRALQVIFLPVGGILLFAVLGAVVIVGAQSQPTP